MKKVLFAHVSSIPHYRVCFYNALERLRPNTWSFDVVFDFSELTEKKFFKEPLNPEEFIFSTLPVKTLTIRKRYPKFLYQTFLLDAAKYDLVIVQNALNNLTYPLCFFHKLLGTRYAFWGHDYDHGKSNIENIKNFAEKLKIILAIHSDGFFAYTQGAKKNLIDFGVPKQKIFPVDNTIDIYEHRVLYDDLRVRREIIRQELGLHNKKVLLFVGTFSKRRRLDILYDAFKKLVKKDDSYYLLMVGRGDSDLVHQDMDNIRYYQDYLEVDGIAPIYTASDLFVFPGWAGLGPLQALCYDLPVMTIDSQYHPPEFEYLNKKNSIILDDKTTADSFALAISHFFQNKKMIKDLKTTIWPSINHLTIENMATQFIKGIDYIIG